MSLPGYLDHHIVAYGVSRDTGILYELDGGKRVPLPTRCRLQAGEDMLSKRVCKAILGDFAKNFRGQVRRPCAVTALVYWGGTPSAMPFDSGES